MTARVDWAGGSVVTHGHQLFADELTVLATQNADPRLSRIAAAITAPLQVAVTGRRGVGRRTVVAALAAAGIPSGSGAHSADLWVHVVAEVRKPEDDAAVRAAGRRPVLVVLNKTDLLGRDGAASSRASGEPMSALFAVAGLGGGFDDRLWEALRCLAARPADLSSAERLVNCVHPVPQQIRQRLCDTVDVSGIAALLDLARSEGTLEQGRARLVALSGVDGVLARLEVLGAAVYHRRMTQALLRLEAMAVADPRIDEFLVRDATVAARLGAAAAVMDLPDEPLLGRARRWHAHSGAPVGPAARACAADIARGSLRAWAATRS
ncbi:hypothetical protein BST33_12165 [Mycolicibacter minnesotensis]|uniref:Uncharacterized protein n=1 Tax=Mycolicibacter minnesotensis TaxID=1118379 RepID=A0AA91M4R4_9MYCO|nr:hypothetical protein [Mycolicibacter minnesotensis]ORB00107.1 hypothetical protein BST33_12165 [Mycolicibacter minnesotensis]